jgi:hypothetical protein
MALTPGSTGRSARLRARQPIPAAFDPIQDEPRAQIPNPLIGDPFFADLAIADDGSYAYANPGGFTNFKCVAAFMQIISIFAPFLKP